MKITGEARLLLIMALAVLLGGGAMVLVNKTPSLAPAAPSTPTPVTWSAENYNPLVKQASHVRGDVKSPKVTIVEFGDLECPSCRRAYNSLLTKLDASPGVRFIFQQFPLPMHPQAMPAAIAIEAAGMQGKFWPMFDALYTGEKTELNQDFYLASAAKVGLNMTKFKSDLAHADVTRKVTAEQEFGQQLHINETPTFVIRDEASGRIYQEVGAKKLDARLSQITGKPPLLPADFK